VRLQILREKLKKEFYVDNLYEIAYLCRNWALDFQYPAPFLLLEHIFQDMARRWEDIPLTVEEAAQVKSKMIEPLEGLVEELEANAPAEEILDLLNRVTSAYLICFK
jgi:hypothetical protein